MAKLINMKTELHRKRRHNDYNKTCNKTHRNDPHLLGGTRLSVLGEVLRSEERAQEFLLTRDLWLEPGESGWPRSVMSLLRTKC